MKYCLFLYCVANRENHCHPQIWDAKHLWLHIFKRCSNYFIRAFSQRFQPSHIRISPMNHKNKTSHISKYTNSIHISNDLTVEKLILRPRYSNVSRCLKNATPFPESVLVLVSSTRKLSDGRSIIYRVKQKVFLRYRKYENFEDRFRRMRGKNGSKKQEC